MKIDNQSMSPIDSKKTSIALMCTSLNLMAGGLERQIILTAESLSNDYNVYLISFDTCGDVSFYSMLNSVVWLKCGCGLPPHESAGLLARIYQLLHLRKLLRRNKIKCLITFHHGLYLRSLFATLFTSIVNIVSERNSLVFYDYIKMRRNNLSLILSFLAPFRTVQLKAYLQEYPKRIRQRIRVIPNFTPLIEEYDTPALGSRSVLMVGRLEAQKNFQLLLEQMLNYPHRLPFKLQIAGEGQLRNLISTRYKSLIDNGSLVLLGNVKDIFSIMRQSSLLCFPSLWEGYPNAVLESLACGLPIVTSRRMAHLSDFVEHNVNGLIVDDEFILKATIDLVQNDKLLMDFSHSSHIKFRNLKSQNPGDRWRSLIREAL